MIIELGYDINYPFVNSDEEEKMQHMDDFER
jgi:hypothetical protein